MDQSKDKNLNQPENKEILVVDAKPQEAKKTIPGRIDNLRIDKIGDLTLNLVVQPLKKRYEEHYKKDKIHLIVDILLVAIILVLLGVLLNIFSFARGNRPNLVDFQVQSNPEKLINGQETEFTIDYTNKTRQTLTDVNLVLKRPASLHNPQYNIAEFDSKTNTLQIGNLESHAHGQFKVKGFFLGNLETKQEFIAVMNYKNQYGQDRQEFFQQSFELNGSALQAEMAVKEKVIATSPFISQIKVKNTSDINFDNVKISLAWPDNLTFVSSNLGEPSNKTWTIGNYETAQEAAYEFTAKAYINEPQTINVRANFYATYEGQEYLLGKAEKNIWVDFSKFKITLTNLENTQAITPGETAKYSVHYANGENYALTNVEISLNARGEYAPNKIVTINQNDNKALAQIEPGQEGTVEIPLTAKSAVEFTKETANYNLEVRAIASYDDSIENARISVESKPTVTKINSRLTLNTAGLFYTSLGDQIGVGSVPPVVGEYTSYWIIIKLVNTNNNIRDLKITAQVPTGIEFTDIYNVTEGNQIVYNQDSGTITWTIGEVSRFAGIFGPAPEARIQLAITPTSKQVGTSPALLTNITATATDSETGAFLTASGKNVTTSIFEDKSLNKVVE